jgi:hypothetical protein
MVSRAHQQFVNSLFADEADRQLATAFIEEFGDVPGMADKVPALLQEAARSAGQVSGDVISAEAARAHLASFATDALGIAPHLMQPLTNWFDAQATIEAAAPDAAESAPAQSPQAPAQQAPPAPVQPPASAPASPALADRVALRHQIAQHEANMRATQGSEQWRDYWQRGGDASYRDALTRLQASTDALAQLAAAPPASAPAAPAQPAPAAAPAPGPAAPVAPPAGTAA